MMLSKKLSRALSALLIICFAFPLLAFTANAETKTHKADGVNTARGEAQIIVYTPEYGSHTGTNQWGVEVIVGSDKKVSGYEVGNSAIPDGGFVISGHNSDTDRVGDNLKNLFKLGDYVSFNKDSLMITVSSEKIAESSFYTLTADLNGVNIFRGEDYLVVYDKAGTRTGTNDWGYEIACINSRVTEMGGNNSLVPAGGFIVSSHGKSSEWIKKNIKYGMKVEYDVDEKKIYFKSDDQTATFNFDIKYSLAESEYGSAYGSYRMADTEAARAKLDEAKGKFDSAKAAYDAGGDYADFEAACSAALELITEVNLLLAESRAVEYRGVWVRPTQTTKAQVEEYVQMLYDAGINMVSVETLYDSTMIMPMPEDSFFEQNPGWKGFDMLQAYIDACHSRGMELHIWMPIYYVGHQNGKNAALGVASKKPEWLSKTNTGSYFSPSDSDNYFLISPANEEAKEFLLKTYKYILETYDIDGFQLDYIRYFLRTAEADFGYDEASVEAFKAVHGVTPTYDTKSSSWRSWVSFRASLVTEMVKSIRELIDTVKPGVMLSADVDSSINNAYWDKYQDYKTWVENGWIDILHPMAYGEGYENDIEQMSKFCSGRTLLAVGLGTFMPELNSQDMLRQAIMVNNKGGNGSVYFEASAYLRKGVGALMTSGFYSEYALPPALDRTASIEAAKDFLFSRIDEIILPREGMTGEEATGVKKSIDDLMSAYAVSGDIAGALEAAYTVIRGLGDAGAASAIESDLVALNRLISIDARISALESLLPEPSEPEESAEPNSSPAESSEPEGKTNLTYWIIAAAAVIIIAGIAIIPSVKKKNK